MHRKYIQIFLHIENGGNRLLNMCPFLLKNSHIRSKYAIGALLLVTSPIFGNHLPIRAILSEKLMIFL